MDFDSWNDDLGSASGDGWRAPSALCCEAAESKCLACGHVDDCNETSCCHNFEKIEWGSEELLRHDDEYCDCRRCDCRTSDFAKCPACGHGGECAVETESICDDHFQLRCWCPDQPEFGEPCTDCHHRRHCFEPNCQTSPHCDCRVENPASSFCAACDHTLACELTDCSKKLHHETNELELRPIAQTGTIIPDPELVTALERLEELRDKKNSASAEYDKLRKQLLEGPLKAASTVLDPIDNSSVWVEIVTKDKLYFPQAALRELAIEFPEAHAKFARPTSSQSVVFSRARKHLWWLRGKSA